MQNTTSKYASLVATRLLLEPDGFGKHLYH